MFFLSLVAASDALQLQFRVRAVLTPFAIASYVLRESVNLADV